MSDYVTLFLTIDRRVQAELARLHGEADHAEMEKALFGIYGETLPVRRLPRALPVEGEEEGFVEPAPDSVVVGLDPVLRSVAESLPAKPGIQLSANLPIAPAELWCPATATSPLFGRVDRAKALIGTEALDAVDAKGAGVNVVIVDQGIDAGYLGDAILNGRGVPRGWPVTDGDRDTPTTRYPGKAEFGHGTKMALLVHHLAPKARIYDLPLLPPRIRSVAGFLDVAQSAMHRLLGRISQEAALSAPRRWVLCNAWAVYDLSADIAANEIPSYGQNPNNAFTRAVAAIVAAHADVVFAAGNCGQYCPDGRCGSPQVGPGNSIYGVAALGSVLTVGAVRSDRTWLGYSSQGPSPASFASSKPDLSAPSQFADDRDARIGYTGSSTACALAAGGIAALRDRNFPWKGAPPSPAGMITGLRSAAAIGPGATRQDPQYGDGILDLAAFVAMNRI